MNGIKTLSESFFSSTRLRSLEILNLSMNKLKKLPLSFFTGLPLLRELDISFNRFKSYPEEFKLLTSLKKLQITGNYTHKLPGFLARIDQL